MNPSSGDLGSIQVSINLELQALQKQVADAVGMFNKMGQKIDDVVTKTQANILRQYTTAVERQNRLAQQQADRQIREAKRAAQEIEREQKRHTDAMLKINGMIGGAATRVGMVGVAGLGIAAKEASEFDTAMRYANTVMGLGEQQFASFRGEVLKFAQDPNIRRTPKELADALFWIASAGYTGQKALDVLKVSAIGAQGGMTDASSAAKALTSVLDSGIPGVKNAAQAMDVIHQAVLLGKMQFPEFANNIGRVDSLAAQAGVTLQETGAAIAAMTRRGMSGAEAFTSFNSILSHLVHPSRQATKVLDELGIAHGITALNARGLTNTLDDMTKASEKDKQKLIEMMPEIRGLRGLLTLTDRDGRSYTEMLKQMGAATEGVGASQKASEQMGKAFSEKLNKLKKDAEVAGIAIGTNLIPELNKLVGWLSNLATGFNNLDPAAKASWTRIAEIATASALAIGGISKLIGWVGRLGTALGGVSSFFGLGIAATGATAIGAAGLDAADWENRASKAKEDAANLPTTLWYNKAREWQKKLELNEASKKLGMPRGSNFLSNGYLYHRMTEDEEMTAKVEAARLMKRQKEELAQWRKFQGLPLASTTPNATGGGGDKPTPKHSATKEESRAARDAAREREQALKDAIRETQDEAKQLEQLTVELKRLSLAGYALSQFNAQTDFFKSVGEAKSQRNKQVAGALYVAQVQKAQAEYQKEQWQKQLSTMSAFEAPDGQLYGTQAREQGWKTLSSGMASVYAQEQYMKKAQEALDREIEEQKRTQDEIARYKLDMNEWNLQKYMEYLQKRKEAERTFSAGGTETSEQSSEYRRVSEDLYRTQLDIFNRIFGKNKGGKEAMNGIAEGMSSSGRIFRSTCEGLARSGVDAFSNTFRKMFGKGNIFGDALSSALANFLSSSIEEALKRAFSKKKKKGSGSSIVDSIFGGGSGVGSFLGMFGFDDGGNDRVAQGWGFDFAKHFERGITLHHNQRARLSPVGAGAGGGATNHTININIPSVAVHTGQDVAELSRTIAWQVQNELRRTVGHG